MNWLFYGLATVLLILSYLKDKNKTKNALKKAWKSFDNILPELLSVMMFVGFLLALLNPELISKIIGADSGWYGVLIAAVVGSVTLIPGFVAFPTAALLLDGGAGFMQIGAFISTLMMVGIVTMPVEIKYFGKRATVFRNLLSFVFSLLVALIIGWAVTV